MKTTFAILIVLGAIPPIASFAEQSWEVRGDFVALKAGETEVVVLRVPGGGTIEVPLESLSPPGQAAARKFAAAAAPPTAVDEGDDGDEGAVVTVRGPFGRTVRVPVPESIKDVEADAIHCRSAAAATDVYRLFLAGDRPTPAQRTAAEARQREWAAMADKGLVRLGERWVPKAEARAAADEATKVVDHALELMRLGNADLAEEELRKAARIDPESGRASFITGLSYALVAKNATRAHEQFTDVVRREPDHAAALSNLAVLEVYARRYPTMVDHFRDALSASRDPLPVAENVAWAVKLAGDAKASAALAKNRMPDKTVDELNALYRTLTQDLRLKPPATVTAPRFLGPDGVPCVAATIADIAKQVEAADAAAVGMRHALGFVVAPGYVVCPREAVATSDGAVVGDVSVDPPAGPGRALVATVVAAPEDGVVALLRCEGLEVDALPLAETMPPLPAILAVDRSGESWLAVRPSAARGKVVTPALEAQARGRFLHTAVVSRGPGGGPIADESGRVVGMVAATPRTDASGNAAGFGIPVERIWPLVKEHLPDVGAAENATKAGDATAAGLRAGAGTVVVSATKSRVATGGLPPGAPR